MAKKLLTIYGNLHVMMKSSTILNLPFGLASYLCGVIFVSRSSSSGLFSKKSAFAKSIEVLTVKKVNSILN